ncbi:MAG: endo-1,4-beta-xylanase [Lachnospiraceae bacterium]|nr:endo-1,4-beta-xylanase [Lachnospiraceae bacterium]
MRKRLISICILLTFLLSGCGRQQEEQILSENAAPDSTMADASAEQETQADGAKEAESADVEPEAEATGGETEAAESSTAQEVPILRDCYEQTMGGYIGCAVTGTEIDDPKVFEIMTTHFNAVTLGNELKPDAIFGYSNSRHPGLEETELNGVTMEVPKMDFSRAEKMLDKIYDWNQANPEKQLKVRGHVLVWHSQTPEWFFHEDYDKEKPYVTAEVMNLRLEWYIKSVLQHFTGEDSKYKDMFYGWDVLNEAISDGTGTYRSEKENASESLSNDTHGSNSSWWAVYQSEEYIINAFTYANKYAPESLELYYNDYNECNLVKRNGILALLQTVKDHEGAPGEGTRISGMGMQGHYNMDNPSASDIEYSIKEYSKVVGKVQITELDMRASDSYTGTEESKLEEYEAQRKRYNMIYYGIKSAVNTGEDVQFDGITFWGTVDHYSWLQSRSDVGGGNTTGLPCCPLLFDENYQPKPCFYVFADSK